jgi:hypothetical protein
MSINSVMILMPENMRKMLDLMMVPVKYQSWVLAAVNESQAGNLSRVLDYVDESDVFEPSDALDWEDAQSIVSDILIAVLNRLDVIGERAKPELN